MKRFIAALSLAVVSVPTLAQTGQPFEQLDINRALPNIPDREVTATVYPFGGSAPYEQLAVNRALPDVVTDERITVARVQGDTRSDAEIAVDEQPQATESPFANDPHFVAPAP